MIKVSVIMPVYNAEDYLEESINCILNQTLTDLELICVDDGSTDSSLEILNRFRDMDDRVQVYHQENRGGGAARNKALTYTTGKYLYCMDADDMIKLDALERLYDVAEEKDVDFVIFQAINYDDERGEYYHHFYYDMKKVAKRAGDKIFDMDDLGDYIFKVSVTPWCKLYNLDFVKKSGAQFAEGLIFHDNIFFWEILFNAKRIYFLKECLYIRRRHINSSTGAKDKRYVSTIMINNMIIQKFINHGYFEKYKARLYDNKMNSAYRRYKEVKDEYKPYFYGEMKKDFTKMVGHEYCDEFLKIIEEPNRQRFEDVVNSKDYEEFAKLYEAHEVKKDALNQPSKNKENVFKRIFRALRG